MKLFKFNIIIVFASALLLAFASSSSESGMAYVKTNKKAEWIKRALDILKSGTYPRIKAVSWWHENFSNSLLQLDSSVASLAAYVNGIGSAAFSARPIFNASKLAESPSGLYHSAFPNFGSTEDIVTAKRIADFEVLVNKKIVWAYFSNNWLDNIKFPSAEISAIRSAGAIPFIRIMPRTDFAAGCPDRNYTMAAIVSGKYDSQIARWAIDARDTNVPLLAEFGTEVNGDWFPWNGKYNGGGIKDQYGDENFPDGPEIFRDAYRHMIDICNTHGAHNITWFFHVNADSQPSDDWNNIANYYPGDAYIDWTGLSVYGPQSQQDDYIEFSEIIKNAYEGLTALTAKPIAILEFAISELE